MNAVAHPNDRVPRPPAKEAASDSVRMVRTLVTVATLSGIVIVLAYRGTLPFIEANEAAAIEQAVFEVVPDAIRRVTFGVTPEGELTPFDPKSGRTLSARIHAAYTESGALAGVAIEASAKGYSDVIKGLYGYDPHRQVITGLCILENKETPGLGDKIAKDPAFLANFDGMDVRVDEGGAPVHPITAVKPGQKTESWQIDGISGATISTQAVATMLRDSAARVIPVIRRNLGTLEAGAHG